MNEQNDSAAILEENEWYALFLMDMQILRWLFLVSKLTNLCELPHSMIFFAEKRGSSLTMGKRNILKMKKWC